MKIEKHEKGKQRTRQTNKREVTHFHNEAATSERTIFLFLKIKQKSIVTRHVSPTISRKLFLVSQICPELTANEMHTLCDRYYRVA